MGTSSTRLLHSTMGHAGAGAGGIGPLMAPVPIGTHSMLPAVGKAWPTTHKGGAALLPRDVRDHGRKTSIAAPRGVVRPRGAPALVALGSNDPPRPTLTL